MQSLNILHMGELIVGVCILHSADFSGLIKIFLTSMITSRSSYLLIGVMFYIQIQEIFFELP